MPRSALTLVLATGLALLVGCPSPLDDDDSVLSETSASWSMGPSLFAPLQEHAVVVRDREFIVLGGFDDQPSIVDRVEAYDVDSGSWRALPPLPIPLHHVNAAALPDGTLVVAGASRTASFIEQGLVWTLAPAASQWVERTPMPAGTERGSAATGVLDGRLHVVGGLRQTGVVDWHWAWDPAEDAWEERAAAPLARDHGAHGVLDGKLVVVGGRGGTIGTEVRDVWLYDPAADTWERGADMPRGRGGTAGATLDGELYVLGGEGNDEVETGVFPDVDAYDPVTDSWRSLPDLPLPVHGMGAAGLDGRIWVPAGADGEALGPVGGLQVLTP